MKLLLSVLVCVLTFYVHASTLSQWERTLINTCGDLVANMLSSKSVTKLREYMEDEENGFSLAQLNEMSAEQHDTQKWILLKYIFDVYVEDCQGRLRDADMTSLLFLARLMGSLPPAKPTNGRIHPSACFTSFFQLVRQHWQFLLNYDGHEIWDVGNNWQGQLTLHHLILSFVDLYDCIVKPRTKDQIAYFFHVYFPNRLERLGDVDIPSLLCAIDYILGMSKIKMIALKSHDHITLASKHLRHLTVTLAGHSIESTSIPDILCVLSKLECLHLFSLCLDSVKVPDMNFTGFITDSSSLFTACYSNDVTSAALLLVKLHYNEDRISNFRHHLRDDCHVQMLLDVLESRVYSGENEVVEWDIPESLLKTQEFALLSSSPNSPFVPIKPEFINLSLRIFLLSHFQVPLECSELFDDSDSLCPSTYERFLNVSLDRYYVLRGSTTAKKIVIPNISACISNFDSAFEPLPF